MPYSRAYASRSYGGKRNKRNRYRSRNLFEGNRGPKVSRATKRVASGKKPTGYDWSQIARDVMRVGSAAAVMYSKINSELKSFDINPLINTTVGATWTNPLPLLRIPQGDTIGMRNGNMIRIKSLQIKGSLTGSAAATAGTLLRLVVIKAADNNFANTDYAAASPTSMRNLSNTKQLFSVFDKLVNIGSTGDALGHRCFSVNIPLDMHVQYESNATADPDNENLWFMAVSDQGTNSPAVGLASRIRFYDN